MRIRESALCLVGFVTIVFARPSAVQAAYVTPMRGGGQYTPVPPMIHCDVFFDGTDITLNLHGSEYEVPVLRPLTGDDSFDPDKEWSVLQNRAYNWQYAWAVGGGSALPEGCGFWIERLHQDAGLEVYMRPMQWTTADGPKWTQILATDGSRWPWKVVSSMQHNAYAVLNPTSNVYQATYRAYVGDITTGDPVAGYGSAEVTWTWYVPEPTSAVLLAGSTVCLLAQRGRAGRRR